MDVGRSREPVTQFVIRVAPDNPASIMVGQRLGFQFNRTTNDDDGLAADCDRHTSW